MRFTLNIETGNAAMVTGADVAEVLGRIALELADYPETDVNDIRIRDINGNTVGSYSLVLDNDTDRED